jgi:ABC-2 type transport system permease protein
MNRFLAILVKEFRQIRRDPLSLGLLIFIPALMLMLYGYALSFDVKHIQMAVLDQDHTRESREFLDSLFQNPYFDRACDISRPAEADHLLDRGVVRGVLIVPRGYSARLARGEAARVQVLVDGAEANAAAATMGYLESLTDRATRQMTAKALRDAGRQVSLPMVAPEPRVWFNPELRSAKFLVPGLIAMLLMLSAVITTSLSIVREKEHETMEQIMVSPVKPYELVMGKTMPYVAIGFVTMGLILLLGRLLFDIHVQGSYLLLGAGTLLFLFAALGMGILISAVTRSQQIAFTVAIITSLLPSILLSGLIFPIRNMPWIIQVVTHIVVPRYFVAVLRGVILKGATLSSVWREFACMFVLGLVFNFIAARVTRKTV